MCKEAGIILVFKHNDVLVDKLRVHGVSLDCHDKTPLELREKLGGHVIIGIEYHEGIDFKTIKRADVDYVIIGNSTTELLRSVSSKAEEAGVNIPLVAEGIHSENDMSTLHKAGAAGFNINIKSLKGPDYTLSLSTLIQFCDTLRQ